MMQQSINGKLNSKFIFEVESEGRETYVKIIMIFIKKQNLNIGLDD